MNKSSKLVIGLGALLAIAGFFWIRGAQPAAAQPVVEVWRSPTCGCCGAWVEHMEKAGFEVKVHESDDLTGVMSRNGVPGSLGSCHTARVGGYVIEGHVPADLVKKLLHDHPAGVRGLSVPGMVTGSPGMEGGGWAQPYQVMAFDSSGRASVYAER